jgi:hypothetical protein
MSIVRGSAVLLFGCLLGATGCGGEAPDAADVDVDLQPLGPGDGNGIITGNGAIFLTPELIALYTPLASLLTATNLSVANIEANDLLTTLGGSTFLRYAVGCALPAGQSVVVNHLGAQLTLEGKVGLAPEWTTGALSTSSKRWLSACILAHVNMFGESVPILLTGDHPALRGSAGAGAGAFTLREGAFYGNLFGLLPQMYACTGEGSVPSRVCAQGLLGLPLSLCAFTVPGHCRSSSGSVCASDVDGSFRNCESALILPLLPGPKYAETITVYVQP